MIIVNATKVVKTIMTDKGSLVSIMPGECSTLMIASRNLIITAMNLGTPSEIGIVINGSYEMDIAKNITGSVPYLYTDIEDAKAKLLDPSIDYKSKLETVKISAEVEETINKKDEEIKSLKNIISEKDRMIANLEADTRSDELEAEVTKLTKENKDLISDKTRLASQVKELQDQITNQNDTLNNLRSENGTLVQEAAGQSDLINKLNIRIKELENVGAQVTDPTESDEYKSLKSAYEDELKKSSELEAKVDSFRTSLNESATTIESMKTSFNAACAKFGLYLDDNGEWQQDASQVE